MDVRVEHVTRAEQIYVLDVKWACTVRLASEQLIRDTYSRVFVPNVKVFGCKKFTRKDQVLMIC